MKKLLLLFALCGDSWGQAIVQKLIDGVTVNTTSTIIKNKGQSQHVIYVTVTGAGCSSGPTAIFQASLDGVTYFDAAAIVALSPTAGLTTGTINANSVFPYMRVVLAHMTGGGTCTGTVWYTGQIYPFSGPQWINNYPNYLQTVVTPSTAVTVALASVAAATQRVMLYGFVASNQDAATRNTLTIFTAASGLCASPLQSVTFTLGVNGSLSSSYGGVVPILIGTAGSALCLTTSAATAVSVTATYRYEP